jgi:hypothetical protein
MALCTFCQYRKDVTKTGLVHACAFLLLRLSACREFGVSLNATFWSSTLPISDIPAFNGSMADLLVLIIHKFIVTSPEVRYDSNSDDFGFRVC